MRRLLLFAANLVLAGFLAGGLACRQRPQPPVEVAAPATPKAPPSALATLPPAPPVPPAPPAPAWEKLLGADEWGGLYMNGKKCGYMHDSFKREQRGGEEVLVYRSEVHVRMKYQEVEAAIGSLSRQEFSVRTGELLLAESKIFTGPVTTIARVEPEGEFFKCVLTAGNQPVEKKLPRCRHNLESVLAPQILATRPEAKAGDKLSVEMLLPETASVMRVEAVVEGRSTITFRGVATEVTDLAVSFYKLPPPGEPPPENETPSATSRVKVDALGRLIEGQIMGPVSFRMESKETAMRLDAVSDVMQLSGISLGAPVKGARGAKEAVLKLTGMPEAFMINDGRQKFARQADGSWRLTLQSVAAPEKCPPLAADRKQALAKWLAPTPFLQSDDPAIRKLAAETVKGEPDSYKAAGLLCDWVYTHIAKEFTPAVSNALDTLNTRKGDCGEHSALCAALCRAAGIPAREVTGLAYAVSGGRGVLGGHAWVEVNVGGEWVALDPTLGQKPADALHLKIAEDGFGDVAGMMRLAELTTALKAEVVSVNGTANERR